MFKKIMILGTVMLLSSCGAQSKADDSSTKRFQYEGGSSYNGASEKVLILDTKTGCEYLRGPDSSSAFIYVHGSCTDIIKEENGVK